MAASAKADMKLKTLFLWGCVIRFPNVALKCSGV